jgi:hypothetical protein
MIGEFVYDLIQPSVGDDLAPKLTGMIIDLPLEDLTSVVTSYDSLMNKVNEGRTLLEKQ